MIETTFTPFQSLRGGALIGLASVLLMATLGRVMGGALNMAFIGYRYVLKRPAPFFIGRLSIAHLPRS
jgi:hypothetical protein